MIRSIVVFNALNAYLAVSAFKPIYTGPLYVPTNGEVWPKPQKQVKHTNLYIYNSEYFKVKIIQETCHLLREAIKRCIFNLNRLQNIVNKYTNSSSKPKNDMEPIRRLHVELTNECEEYPHLGMGEEYSLTVAPISKLSSATIWGIIRGLETFSQLFFVTSDYTKVCTYQTEIYDYPRFTHRGLLIDTSRHFLSIASILTTIKALAINKMNVLHWHMTDDQSFPYESETLPELSARGAFHTSMVYKISDIKKVIEYARERGIRVIPEFDMPGHTLSWGMAFPKILTECFDDNKENLGQGALNPIKEATYKVIRDLLNEVQGVFKDKYIHLGGDETNFACWESNPRIDKYMKEHSLSAPSLLALFFNNVFSAMKNDSSAIVWQEVFDQGVPLNFDTIIQVWKGDAEDMMRPIQAGYQVVYSTKWYLDQNATDDTNTFNGFYMKDPRKMVMEFTNNVPDSNHVIGGEACMWGELVDDSNLMTKVWPRTCAVAERLWSAAEPDDTVPVEVNYRLVEHICRMIRRSIPLQPSAGPGFCVV